MRLSLLLTINAILAIAGGIAFTLYGPVMLAFFNIPELPGGNTLLYWNIASFARLFGAVLFALGMLIWSIRLFVDQPAATSAMRRGISFSLLMGNGIAAVVALTQQASIWSGLAGWVMFALFALLTLGYGYTVAINK